ncbi:MAG: MBL fold metallo-hydrolase [Proteobacteria bacterium]|nr:MBL fold metallo-hydrolase [Pseudomonadota bacterium]
MKRVLSTLLCLSAILPAFAGPAWADSCLGPIARAPALYHAESALLRPAALAAGEVAITYIGHSTFTIETPGGVIAATDYNDYVRPQALPDVATMNHAHLTHYTPRPDPAIRHVLRGWSFDGRKPSHDIQERDLRVRNVPTNIRGEGGTEYAGNSIFIFEAAGLCIAHLGHLHHTLTPEHLKAIGQVDIVLAAVDGSWTVDLDGIVEVIGQLNPKLVIPMHYMSRSVLERFLTRMRDTAEIRHAGNASMVFSRAKLPTSLAILVLDGR